MTAVNETGKTLLFMALAATGALGLSYLVVGREMSGVVHGVVLALLLLVGFASVKLSLILLVFCMLLSPEIEVGATSRREITVRLEDIMLLVMTLGWMLRMAVFKSIGFVLRTPLNKPIAVYSGIAVLATAVGMVRGDVNSMSGFFFTLKILEYFVLFSVVVNYLTEEREVHTLLSVHLLVFAIIVGYGLYQVAVGGDIAAPFEGEAGERNTLGGYLVLMGSVAGGLLLHSDSSLERKLMGALVALGLCVLLFSLSRSGWVSCLVAMTVLFFSARQKNIYLLMIAVFVLVLPFALPEVVWDRVNFTFYQPLHPGQQVEILGVRLDTSTSARILTARDIFRHFVEHPILGFGVTGFRFVDGHFLGVLIETGILGLAAFGWLLAGMHRMIRDAASRDLPPRLRGMVIGFHAGFWAMIAHALSANTFLIVRIAEPFWSLAGLTVAATLLCREGSADEQVAVPIGSGLLRRAKLEARTET